MSKILNNPVSSYKKITDREGEKVPLSVLMPKMMDGTFEKQIADVRSGKAQKNTLPAFTPSGLFNGQRSIKGLVQPSGLICLDFDNPQDRDRAKEFLASDPYVFAAGISAGGNGLFCIVDAAITSDSDLKQKFPIIAEYFHREYGLIADEACKDISRLRFVTHDPDLYINEEAETFDLFPPIPESKNDWNNLPDFETGKSIEVETLPEIFELAKAQHSGVVRYATLRTFIGLANKKGIPEKEVHAFLSDAWATAKDADSTTNLEKALLALSDLYTRYADQHGMEALNDGVLEIIATDIPTEDRPALTLNGVPLICAGEIFTLVALPNAGKSQTMANLVIDFLAQKFGTDIVGAGFGFTSPGSILYVDTERTANQNKITYQSILRHFTEHVENGRLKGLTYLVMSQVDSAAKVRQALRKALAKGKYDIVVLDGVLDAAESLNDEVSSKQVVTVLRALAVEFDIGLVTTLHPNKGTNTAAGHLGAFLYRYSRAMLLMRYSDNDRSVRELTAFADGAQTKLQYADAATFEPLFYRWDEEAKRLVICHPPEKPSGFDPILIKQAFFSFQSSEVQSGQLCAAYASLKSISEASAKRHLQEASKAGLLIKKGAARATTYTLFSEDEK